MRDQHGFRFLIHQQDGYDFAVALGGLDVDHALAAARLLPVLVNSGAFAVPVFGDRQDHVGDHLAFVLAVSLAIFLWLVLGRDRHADDVVAVIEVHTAHTISRAAHGADIFFAEADSHAFVRCQEDDLLPISQGSGNQLIAFINADGDNAARHYIREIS